MEEENKMKVLDKRPGFRADRVKTGVGKFGVRAKRVNM